MRTRLPNCKLSNFKPTEIRDAAKALSRMGSQGIPYSHPQWCGAFPKLPWMRRGELGAQPLPPDGAADTASSPSWRALGVLPFSQPIFTANSFSAASITAVVVAVAANADASFT